MLGISTTNLRLGGFRSKLINAQASAFKARVLADSGTFEAESCLTSTVQDLVNKGLYDSASLIVTPNAVKSGKIYALKGTDLTFTRASVANRTNSVGAIESVASGVPRIQYPADLGCPSILLEPQRTNLCIYSCQFTNAAWVTNASGVTLDNQVLAPDGTLTAGTFESTGSTALLQNANATVVVATTYTSGIWVKLISGSSVVKVRDVSGNETVITPNSTWQYFKITLAATSTTGRVAVVIATAGTKIAVWNGQLEAGGFSTSPIITTSAAVTRLGDSFINNDASNFGATGTLFISYKNNIAVANDGTHILGFYISNGTQAIYFSNSTAGGGSRIRIWTQAAAAIYLTTTTICKLAITWDGTNINVWENGVKVVTNYAFPYIFDRLGQYSPNIPTYIDRIIISKSVKDDAFCAANTI